jgi:hypothetical protein
VREISTLVGLSFTAILTDGATLLCIYEPHLRTFLRYYREFKEHQEYLHMFSRAIAEIIRGAAFVFSLVKSPAYHEEFIRLIHKALNNLRVSVKQIECNRLIDLLSREYTGLF